MHTLNMKKALLYVAVALLLLISACSLFQAPRPDRYAAAGGIPEELAGATLSQDQAAETHYRLGLNLQKRKRYLPSIEEFKLAVALNPAHAKAFNAMGVSWDALETHDRALDAYEAALRIDPELDCVFNNIGYSYLLRGKPDKAILNFDRALLLDGGNSLYLNNLGLALAESGRYDEALAAFKQNGDEIAAYRHMAQVYYRKRLYSEAHASYEKAYHLAPNDPVIRKGLHASGVMAKIFMPPEAPVYPAQAESQRYKIIDTPAGAPFKAPAAADDHRRPVKAPLEGLGAVAVDDLLSDEAAMAQHAVPRVADQTNGPLERIRIEVLNGNGVFKMAKKVGTFLNGEDFKLMYLANAPHFNHETTQIFYADGYRFQANRLAEKIPGLPRFECVSEIRGGGAEVSILIGKDLIPVANHFSKI